MSNTINIETFEAWANITMEIWQDRMMKYQVRDSGALFSSLMQHVNAQANGSSDRIDFFFLYYGTFVDMGLAGKTVIKAKPWYSTAFYGQVKRLGEIVSEKYGNEATQQIIGFMTSNMNNRITQYDQAPMKAVKMSNSNAGFGFSLQSQNFTK